MDIKEKMQLCFNNELLENKILTENEKKVLASLMYSYQICKEAKDNEIIRSMDALRKDVKISNNNLYDAIRSLESLYHMIERTAGVSRGKEKSSIASKFKLNFDTIFNPPKERVKFDFSKKVKPSETSINTVVIDTVTDIDKEINTNIDRDIKIVSDIEKVRKFDIDCNIEENQVNDMIFENEMNNHYNIDSSLPIKEESIGEYKLNQLIKGFSKAKDIDAIIEQFLEVTKHLSRYTNEESEKYISGMKSAIEKRCVELGIDSNIIFNYYN